MENQVKPQRKLTGVRLDPKLIWELKILAAVKKRTITSLLEEGAQIVLKKYQGMTVDLPLGEDHGKEE
jgi:hypothetical protein